MKRKNTIMFDRSNKTIVFNDTTIIDLRQVSKIAKARFFSKVDDKNSLGYDTVFSIGETERAFNFGMLSLSPVGFVVAAIENQLEIEGMVVNHDTLQDAYKHVTLRRHKLSGHSAGQSA